MPLVKVNDINMYYEIHGQGEPLIIILGLSSDISSYISRLVEPLAKNYQVIAFDNRGAGRTDKPHTEYSMDIMADDAAGLLDALGIESANVLGISMGGRVALSLALNHADKVKNLILSCTYASGKPKGEKVHTSLTMKLLYVAKLFPIHVGKYPQPRYAFLLQREATFHFNVVGRLKDISMPTLIMHGRSDKTVSFRYAEVLHENIKNSILIPFKAGHLYFMGEERPRFISEIKKFLG